jgi:hypothetical protein
LVAKIQQQEKFLEFDETTEFALEQCNKRAK